MLERDVEFGPARRAIQKGSKSFALASFAFADRDRHSAWELYAWCRYADDQIDRAENGEQARENLNNMRVRLFLMKERASDVEFPWNGLFRLLETYEIPAQYPRDLLRGFERDLGRLQIENEEELRDYCYCVAGTVGLMMSHIMGVASPEALGQAEALGRAMQLTNIARDVNEDLIHRRVYLPKTWLDEKKIDPAILLEPSQLRATKQLVDRLVLLAEPLYRQGKEGLSQLPFRASIAVGAALFIYREIGQKILRGSPEVLLQRTVIGKPRKIILFTVAIALAIATIPARLLRPRRAIRSLPLWRPQP